MKRIFPVITILVTISLLGLIFFQVLWLRSAVDFKTQQLTANVIRAVDIAAHRLTEETDAYRLPRKTDLITGG